MDPRVVPATPERWDDVVEVMGTRGDPARCWCQYFRLRGPGWRAATSRSNREALRVQVCADPVPPGVLAYVSDEPVGWCAVAPFPAYPKLSHSTVAMAGRDGAEQLDRVWAVTCFVVRTGHRRRGLAGLLLDGAVDLARTHGGLTVEGYPVDIAARPSASSSELFHGTVSQFTSRGFHEVARPTATRVVVRRTL